MVRKTQPDSLYALFHHSDGYGSGDGGDDVNDGAGDDGDVVSDGAGDDGDGVAEVMNVVTRRGHPGAASSA